MTFIQSDTIGRIQLKTELHLQVASQMIAVVVRGHSGAEFEVLGSAQFN